MRIQLLMTAAMLLAAATQAVHAQAPAPVTAESLVTAAKKAAGQDYSGTEFSSRFPLGFVRFLGTRYAPESHAAQVWLMQRVEALAFRISKL